MIRSSPRMRGSLHISSLPMIGELLLLPMGLTMIILTMTRLRGTLTRTWIDTHLGRKPKLGGRVQQFSVGFGFILLFKPHK